MRIILCSSIWLFVFLLLSWRLILTTRKAFSYIHRLHQVPCSSCAFFTGDYRLKCPINPLIAMSEEAIDCRDFVSQANSTFNNRRSCTYKSQLTKN